MKKSKIYRIIHKGYPKGIGLVGNKILDETTGIHFFGVFGKSVSRYDRKVAHVVARNKSYQRMKKNPRMTSDQLSNAYYKDRRAELNNNGLLRLGIVSQYFKKKK